MGNEKLAHLRLSMLPEPHHGTVVSAYDLLPSARDRDLGHALPALHILSEEGLARYDLLGLICRALTVSEREPS